MIEDGVQPDIFAYNQLLWTLAMAQGGADPETSELVLHRMQSAAPPVAPDAQTFLWMILACVKVRAKAHACLSYRPLSVIIRSSNAQMIQSAPTAPWGSAPSRTLKKWRRGACRPAVDSLSKSLRFIPK